MLRHVLILARDQSSAAVAVTIALDRHLSRGEYVEIVQDRRGEAPEERWPVRQERRRPSSLADQLLTQGYAIISREDETHVPAYQAVAPMPAAAPLPLPTPRPPAAAPPPPPRAPAAGPRIFERTLAERNFTRPPVARAEPLVAGAKRPRLPLDDRQALREGLNEDWSADPDGRDDFARPRRRGGVVAILVAVVVLAVGLVFFSTHARDRLLSAVLPASPPAETTTPADQATPTDPATRADSATEEPARAASGTADRSTPAPGPLTASAGGLPNAPRGGRPRRQRHRPRRHRRRRKPRPSNRPRPRPRPRRPCRRAGRRRPPPSGPRTPSRPRSGASDSPSFPASPGWRSAARPARISRPSR